MLEKIPHTSSLIETVVLSLGLSWQMILIHYPQKLNDLDKFKHFNAISDD